jgi:transposase
VPALAPWPETGTRRPATSIRAARRARTRRRDQRIVVPFVHLLTAHLAEFGIVAPIERNGVEQLLGVVADANDNRLSANKGLS